jgi:hypothetical protein
VVPVPLLLSPVAGTFLLIHPSAWKYGILGSSYPAFCIAPQSYRARNAR